MKLDVLAFAAHPDDTELNCGGTLARLVQQGLKVGVVDLTQGQMGTRGTPEDRLVEAGNAANILGLSVRENLGFKDTELINDRAHQIPIIEQVRAFKPHICLVGAPSDRHPDHGHATKLMLDAIFYSGLRKLESGNNQEAWRPAHILHYMQDRPFEPDFVFDISKTIDQKMASLQAFTTQFNVSDPDGEPETYISSQNYFKQVEARARFYGHLGGFEFGEPFKYYNGPTPLSSFDLFKETSPGR